MNIYKNFGKRLLDIFLCFLSFVLLFPIFIVVSILIFFFDKGPIFFYQTRIGKMGKKFTMIKFRSMPINTKNLPSDEIGKIKISKIGSFIRRTNIDELPQIFNILFNDMSFVGPRPPTLKQKKLIDYRKKNGSINCKPGLTGLAQISSYDGMSVEVKAKFDGLYFSEISFANDLKIIFKTFIYLFKPPPVY